jgi:putative colanic acid biosynthesis acetyltransferase WcaF
MAWLLFGQTTLSFSWIVSSFVRIGLLRLFGARIGERVVMRHPLKVKYPWHLVVGNDCWFGEDCWIDNLTTVTIGNNVCISQAAYICTGNHNWTDPNFGLMVAPVTIEDGAWAGAHCMLAPGVTLGRGAVAGAGSVISKSIPEFEIHAGNPAKFIKRRVLEPVAINHRERQSA